mmetsp:Transcript_16398/g.32984  ORF Transcript_16398/g.32984 Transcript_16398/m.32984 type:complete len:454 (-) Transcript_16398:13-1374(-)
MVKPRRPAAAASSLNGRATAGAIGAAAVLIFMATSVALHGIISSNADDYPYDDDASGDQDDRAAGGRGRAGFFFEREYHGRNAKDNNRDDPLRSGSATRRSRAARHRQGRQGRHERRHGRRSRRMDGESGLDLDEVYPDIRSAHDDKYPPTDTERLLSNAKSLRTHDYQLIEELPYDVNNCPPTPPENYPISWPALDVLNNWNTDDTTDNHSHRVHQGICRFDAITEHDKALAYRNAEVPFVIRDDPAVLPTVERWNMPDYLPSILGEERTYRTDMASSNQLMFFRMNEHGHKPKNWEEPTKIVDMTYPEWLEKANDPDPHALDPDRTHWYFRLNAKSTLRDNYLYKELPFFDPVESFYIVDPDGARGINCRFGMRGNTGENHFDASRNFIALLSGERRYLLSHPNQCKNLALYPVGHPSARHSEVNWADPDLDRFPQFRDAKIHEVRLCYAS